MPPTKFQLNPPCHSGADVISTFSRWLPWQPSWISEQNDFSNSKSPCCSYQVGDQSDLGFMNSCDWRFSSWPGYWNGRILAILIFMLLRLSFGSILLRVLEEMSFEDFQDGHHGSHLGYQNKTILAILNLHVASMPPIIFGLNQS